MNTNKVNISIETTPSEVYGVSSDGIETTPNEVYGVTEIYPSSTTRSHL